MIRYLGQRTDSICGPVALINAFKKMGYPLTGQDIGWICTLVNHNKEYGTQKKDLMRELKRGFIVRPYRGKPVQDNQLLLILYYVPKYHECHYSLVESDGTIINYFDEQTDKHHTRYRIPNLRSLLKTSLVSVLEIP